MNGEPTYRYVKGEGWVPSLTIGSGVVHGRQGKRFCIEIRKPEPGERFTWTMGVTGRFFTDGKPDQTKWDKWAKDNKVGLDAFVIYDKSDYDPQFFQFESRCFVVAVPVD